MSIGSDALSAKDAVKKLLEKHQQGEPDEGALDFSGPEYVYVSPPAVDPKTLELGSLPWLRAEAYKRVLEWYEAYGEPSSLSLLSRPLNSRCSKLGVSLAEVLKEDSRLDWFRTAQGGLKFFPLAEVYRDYGIGRPGFDMKFGARLY